MAIELTCIKIMEKIISVALLLLSLAGYAQVTREPDLTYANNFFLKEAYKGLKDKSDNLKNEANGSLLNLVHQSKGVDMYASSDIFPRSDFHHYVRDFDISFDFYFNNGVSSQKSGNYTYYTSKYCTINIYTRK
jgi:hypothetical protein